MFRNVLVATGPSPWSSNAVDTAIRLAAHLRVEIVIVHILEDDPQFQLQSSVASDPPLRDSAVADCATLIRSTQLPGRYSRNGAFSVRLRAKASIRCST